MSKRDKGRRVPDHGSGGGTLAPQRRTGPPWAPLPSQAAEAEERFAALLKASVSQASILSQLTFPKGTRLVGLAVILPDGQRFRIVPEDVP